MLHESYINIIKCKYKEKIQMLSIGDGKISLAVIMLYLEWRLPKKVLLYKLSPLLSSFFSKLYLDDSFYKSTNTSDQLQINMLLLYIENIIGCDKYNEMKFVLKNSQPVQPIGLSLSVSYYDSKCKNCGSNRILRYFCHNCGNQFQSIWKISYLNLPNEVDYYSNYKSYKIEGAMRGNLLYTLF